MGQRTETPLPVSMYCASWRTKPQHGDCRGVVLLGNRGPLVPCGCRRPECVDEPRHVAAREMAGALR